VLFPTYLISTTESEQCHRLIEWLPAATAAIDISDDPIND